MTARRTRSSQLPPSTCCAASAGAAWWPSSSIPTPRAPDSGGRLRPAARLSSRVSVLDIGVGVGLGTRVEDPLPGRPADRSTLGSVTEVAAALELVEQVVCVLRGVAELAGDRVAQGPPPFLEIDRRRLETLVEPAGDLG